MQDHNRNVYFLTLGCAKNEVDTATMKRDLLAAGYNLVDDVSLARVVVVNTCAFLQAACEESIDSILELRDEIGDAKLVVVGCLPSRYGKDLEVELIEADAFLSCADENNLVSCINQLLSAKNTPIVLSDRAAVLPARAAVFAPSDEIAPYAYIKISDGCNRFCSYCAIPYIRGRYHSFTYESILEEVSFAVESGKREIVFIAQDTGRWGSDFHDGSTLATLLDSIANEFPSVWFRVLYTEPEGITDELIEVVSRHHNICNYFDMPLQHVSPDIVKAMNRSGNAKTALALINKIRSAMPDCALRTTLIAGFPGETDEQFEELCDFIEEAQFDYVGVFGYSREEGTRAADLPDQIDEDTISHRAQALRDLADTISFDRIASRIGSQDEAIVEGFEEDGQLFGRTMHQAPEVDGSLYLDGGTIGELVSVRLINTLCYEMEGEVCVGQEE